MSNKVLTLNNKLLLANNKALKYQGSDNTLVPSNDVNFIDYDGTIRYSYSAAEFVNLSELPPNPSHEGLTAQGWNWALSDAKSEVAESGQLTIGQSYITNDGKTRIYIHLEEGFQSPMLGCCPDGAVTIDWGDGTATETLTGTSTVNMVWTNAHNYTLPGDYVITLEVTGIVGLSGMDNDRSALLTPGPTISNTRKYAYSSSILHIELGSGISIQSYAFSKCYSLSSITIPVEITSLNSRAFRNCTALSSITIPNTFTSISDYSFSDCYSLRTVSIPRTVSALQTWAFNSCFTLTRIIIPKDVTTLTDSLFYGCYSLSTIIIPENITYIGSGTFRNCSFCSVHFLSLSPPTLISSNTFLNLPTDCIIYVPTGSLSAYTSATNYPSSETYTYMEE